MNKFVRAQELQTKRRVKIIDDEAYLKVSALKKFLEKNYEEPDKECTKEFNSGWDCCIADISGEFDLEIGFGTIKNITLELIRVCGKKHREEKKNAKKK